MARSDEIPVRFAKELTDLVRRLFAAAKDAGREEALARMRAAVAGAAARRGPGRPRGSRNRPTPAAARTARTKSARKRRNPWATLSPAERLARVNAIRKGRGLPPREKL